MLIFADVLMESELNCFLLGYVLAAICHSFDPNPVDFYWTKVTPSSMKLHPETFSTVSDLNPRSLYVTPGRRSST